MTPDVLLDIVSDIVPDIVSNCPRSIGANFTTSPGVRRDGGIAAGLNICTGVRPINLQPPGESTGYTAAWLPAIATVPAFTLFRGVSRRGTWRASGKPLR